MNWIKLTSIVLLTHLMISVSPLRSLAAEQGIFLNLSAARKVAIELKVCRAELPYYKTQLPIVTYQRDLIQTKVSLLETQKLNLKSDLSEMTKQKEQFKLSYLKTNEDLQKVNESIPLRKTWFGIGAISVTVAVLLGLFLTK